MTTVTRWTPAPARGLPNPARGCGCGSVSCGGMFARRILQAFVVLALVGAGWVAWAELKLHWHTPMASRSGVVETALALGLPAIVVMVLPMFAARAEGRQDVASYYPRFGETPVLINMFFGALVVGFVVLAFALQPRPDERGAPAILNGEYVLDNHGKITVVDKPTYDHEMATFTDRFPNTVVGGVGALDALAAAITTGWAFQLRSDAARKRAPRNPAGRSKARPRDTKSAGGKPRPKSGAPVQRRRRYRKATGGRTHG